MCFLKILGVRKCLIICPIVLGSVFRLRVEAWLSRSCSLRSSQCLSNSRGFARQKNPCISVVKQKSHPLPESPNPNPPAVPTPVPSSSHVPGPPIPAQSPRIHRCSGRSYRASRQPRAALGGGGGGDPSAAWGAMDQQWNWDGKSSSVMVIPCYLCYSPWCSIIFIHIPGLFHVIFQCGTPNAMDLPFGDGF